VQAEAEFTMSHLNDLILTHSEHVMCRMLLFIEMEQRAQSVEVVVVMERACKNGVGESSQSVRLISCTTV